MTKATLNQAGEINKIISQSGIERDALQKLIESGGLTKLLWNSMGSLENPIITTYWVNIIAANDVLELIRGSGFHGCEVLDDRINWSNFQGGQSGRNLDAQLVYFGPRQSMRTDMVLEALEDRNLRPGTLAELCSLAKAHPDLQREFPIVALGSSLQEKPDDFIKFPYLSGSAVMRVLHLSWDGDEFTWAPGQRFLAVSK